MLPTVIASTSSSTVVATSTAVVTVTITDSDLAASKPVQLPQKVFNLCAPPILRTVAKSDSDPLPKEVKKPSPQIFSPPPPAFAQGRADSNTFNDVLLKTDANQTIILDLRSFLSYNQSHIKDAINVSIPAPLLKKKGFSLAIVEGCICRENDKTKFRNRDGITVLMYDNTDEASERNNTLVNLYTSLKEEGRVTATYWLGGGFESFHLAFPDRCKLAGPITSKLFKGADALNSVIKSLSSHNDSGPDEPVQILNYLFLAGEKVAGSRAVLNKYNIKCIVNAAIECENSFPNDFSYLRLELYDSCNQKCLFELFDKAIDFIHKARDLNQNVLVHCRAGQSRSATIVVAYLMKTLNFDLARAYSYVQRRRPAISPNLGFMGQLTLLDKELHQQQQQQQQRHHQQQQQNSGTAQPASSVNLSAPAQQQCFLRNGQLSCFNLAERLAKSSSAGSNRPQSSPWSMVKTVSSPPDLGSSASAGTVAMDVDQSSNNNSFMKKSGLHTPGPLHTPSSSSGYSMTVEDVPQAVMAASRTISSENYPSAGSKHAQDGTHMLSLSPIKSPRISANSAGANGTPLYLANTPVATLRRESVGSMDQMPTLVN